MTTTNRTRPLSLVRSSEVREANPWLSAVACSEKHPHPSPCRLPAGCQMTATNRARSPELRRLATRTIGGGRPRGKLCEPLVCHGSVSKVSRSQTCSGWSVWRRWCRAIWPAENASVHIAHIRGALVSIWLLYQRQIVSPSKTTGGDGSTRHPPVLPTNCTLSIMLSTFEAFAT